MFSNNGGHSALGLWPGNAYDTPGCSARVVRAIDKLAPAFGLHNMKHLAFPVPAVEVTESILGGYGVGMYNHVLDLIQIRTDHAYDDRIIGEEASHYLHHQINPLKIDDEYNWIQRFRLSAARETVGYYGSIVYRVMRDVDVPPLEKIGTNGISKDHEIIDHFGHVYGYMQAVELFRSGSLLLRNIACMSLEEMDHLYVISPEDFFHEFVRPKLRGK